MSHFRFTIANLLGFVLFIAVGFAALRQATALWDSAVFSSTLVVLSLSVLLAVHRAGCRRAYWLGFALFGWIYLGASLIPPIESRLLTTAALVQIGAKVPGLEDPVALTLNMTVANGLSTGSPTFAFSPNGSNRIMGQPLWIWDAATGQLVAGTGGTAVAFLRIGHALVALVLAYLGGHLSRWLFTRGLPPVTGGDAETPPTPHTGSSPGSPAVSCIDDPTRAGS
jgi:hypothetical protein